MSTRARQVLVVALGAVAAVVMVFLGLWQMQVFVDEGNRTVQARAELSPVPLLEQTSASGRLGDLYGKRVTVTGHYLPEQQLYVPTGAGVRVLTAFQVADGRVLPIVRGLAPDAAAAGVPPTGERTETGLFLPGEGDVSSDAAGAGGLGSIRMPLLAQQWPQQLVPGFVTLTADVSAAQGLSVAPVDLPEGEGSFQNGGYALQWWVFSAFALGMSIKIAHGMGARERRALEDAAQAGLATAPIRKDPT